MGCYKLPLMLPPIEAIGAVMVGGMIGALLRVWFSIMFATIPGSFPLATFAENVLGAFLLGCVMVLILERVRPRPFVQPFLCTGIFGSFTTFSNVSVELVELASGGRIVLAILYAAGSLVAGLASVALGVLVARSWPQRPRRVVER